MVNRFQTRLGISSIADLSSRRSRGELGVGVADAEAFRGVHPGLLIEVIGAPNDNLAVRALVGWMALGQLFDERGHDLIDTDLDLNEHPELQSMVMTDADFTEGTFCVNDTISKVPHKSLYNFTKFPDFRQK